MSTNIDTKYGFLNNVTVHEFYTDGCIKECEVHEYNEISTPFGILVPQYEDAGIRRKKSISLSFFNNGTLKSIALQESVNIPTKVGMLPAEYITFYEDGNLRRIFPLNGKLTGYWTEDEEYELAKDISFSFEFGSFSNKIIGLQFYKNQNIKSITFWPKEKLDITTPLGVIPCKIGIALYENGAIKSLEPRLPTLVNTPIGNITAFDLDAIGINGDCNSLSFSENGELISLVTSSDNISITTADGSEKNYKPGTRPSYIAETSTEPDPLHISFQEGKIIFNNNDFFAIDECKFKISKSKIVTSNCSSCSTCTGCH